LDSLTNYRFRKLRSEDAGDISRIYAAITQTTVKTDFRKIVEEQVEKESNASFVAEADGRIVGYMIGYVLTGGFGINKSLWIANLGVDPKYMGRGIGARLAEEIFQFSTLNDIQDVYTSVRWDSTDLLSFFKTLGFDRSNFINLRKKIVST
jgi:ribosomal protein S18 acetylase RimI-like enzyme